MKKLMIAAAAAAMIVGAYADSVAHGVYDVTASVYGMTGKKSKDQSKNYTVNLGKNADGFWYQDDEVITWAGITGTVAGVECVYAQGTNTLGEADVTKKCTLEFPLDVTEAQKEAVAAAFGFDITAKKPVTDYNTKSAGKWCATFKFKHTDYAKCYRVAKNYKLYTQLDFTCCGDNGYMIRFGGPTLAQATKVDWTSADDTPLASKDGTVSGSFTLAGRGTWKDGLVKVGTNTFSFVSSISGYCIGTQDSEITCELCCEDGTEAIQFECDGENWYECTCEPGMAGTFSMKFNKKESYIDEE